MWLAKARAHAGILQPGESFALKPQPDIDVEHERPVVITPHPGDVFLASPARGVFNIRNERASSTPYVFLIVPKRAVEIGSLRWDTIAGEALGLIRKLVEKKT